MTTLIKLKNSLNTSIPGSLANGEPAYTANGDVFYIGSNGQIVPIGGKRVPGTLTANQAIVTNSTNMIDLIMFGNSTVNAVINSISFKLSNSTVTYTQSLPTAAQQAGQYFQHANGAWVLVSSSTPGGSNTFVQFNDSTSLNGTAGFTFDKATNNMTLANTMTIGGSTIANSTVVQVGANSIQNTTAQFVGNSTANSVQTSANFTIANSTGTATLTPTTLTVGLLGGSQINTAANLSFTGANVSIPNANLAVKDLTVSGNLVVTGTLTSVDATNLQVTDSLIKLAKGNAGATLDIGFYGLYNNGADRYTGLMWDASSNIYELYANTTVEPTTTVDTAGLGYVNAVLKAYLNSGALVSNATNLNITANSTLAVALVANTLSLSTALTGTNGGTGLASYTTEDILVANSTNGFRKLSMVANKVLQSNGTAVLYDDIDGGSF